MIAQLPAGFASAIEGLRDSELQRRPVATMWSIAEYIDHVRETTFGMRFILADRARSLRHRSRGNPQRRGSTLSPASSTCGRHSMGYARGAQQLHDQLRRLAEPSWESTVMVGGEIVDVRLIARHASTMQRIISPISNGSASSFRTAPSRDSVPRGTPGPTVDITRPTAVSGPRLEPGARRRRMVTARRGAAGEEGSLSAPAI